MNSCWPMTFFFPSPPPLFRHGISVLLHCTCMLLADSNSETCTEILNVETLQDGSMRLVTHLNQSMRCCGRWGARAEHLSHLAPVGWHVGKLASWQFGSSNTQPARAFVREGKRREEATTLRMQHQPQRRGKRLILHYL
jgi:hypothetical protein